MQRTADFINFWRAVMPYCDEVIWDAREGHLAVRYYGFTGPSAGVNRDIYSKVKASFIINIALQKHKPVYILGKHDKRIRVFYNPIQKQEG